MLFIILKQSISSIHSFQTKFNKRSFQLCLQNIFVVLWICKKGLHFQANLMLCQIKEDTCNVLHSSRPKLQLNEGKSYLKVLTTLRKHETSGQHFFLQEKTCTFLLHEQEDMWCKAQAQTQGRFQSALT